MAITIVQNLNTFVTGSNNLGIVTAATAPGNTLIVLIGVNDLNANVTNGASWIKDVGRDNVGTTACCQVWSWLTPGGETVFTWNFSVGKNAYAQFWEVSGLSVVYDGATNRDRQNGQGPGSSTSIALTELAANQLPDEFAVAGASLPTSGGAFVSMTAGWTNDTGANGINAAGLVYAGHKIISAAEMSANTITWTTARVPAGCIVTYRGVSLDRAWYPLITPS